MLACRSMHISFILNGPHPSEVTHVFEGFDGCKLKNDGHVELGRVAQDAHQPPAPCAKRNRPEVVVRLQARACCVSGGPKDYDDCPPK